MSDGEPKTRPPSPQAPRDISGHDCPVCGQFGPYGYGPPGWPLPWRWYCRDHRADAERQRYQQRWDNGGQPGGG